MGPQRVVDIARCISLTVVVILSEAGTVMADGVTLIVDVHRDSCPSLSATHLARAEDQAQRIFSDAGVRTLWRMRGSTSGLFEKLNGRRVDMVLLCGETAERKISGEAVGSKVLGQAIHDAARAYVYADRVFNVALQYGDDFALVLGRVAAHEVGHLVLPQHSHSRRGIMRARLDFHKTLPEPFTEAQRRTILRNLQQAAADPADEDSVGGRGKR